jgi:uncharacterized ion transporter superfamily protein YfcC
MLTTDEERFVDYWKKNREQEKRTFRQLLIGLPIGLTFAIAILAIFSSGWYERASPFIFVFAIVVIIGFVAIFSKKHRWDMNEQRYLELRHKQNNSITKAAAEPAKQSTDNN